MAQYIISEHSCKEPEAFTFTTFVLPKNKCTKALNLLCVVAHITGEWINTVNTSTDL